MFSAWNSRIVRTQCRWRVSLKSVTLGRSGDELLCAEETVFPYRKTIDAIEPVLRVGEEARQELGSMDHTEQVDIVCFSCRNYVCGSYMHYDSSRGWVVQQCDIIILRFLARTVAIDKSSEMRRNHMNNNPLEEINATAGLTR